MTTQNRLRWGTSAAAVALIAFATAGTAHAGTTALDKGGAFCLRLGNTEPGMTSTVLVLDIDPADHRTNRKLWWISGYEQGSNPSVVADNYVDPLNGTATVAKPNNGKTGKKVIQMGLSGQGFGPNTDAAVTGLWTHTYNLQLDRKTLKGGITGLSVFTPITGSTAGAPVQLVVNQKVTRMACTNV